jgi:protein-tyrosine phosphatase
MNQIRTWLYIGKYRETLDVEWLNVHQIGAMLQLAERVEKPGITTLYLNVDDGVPIPPDLLTQGIHFVKTQHEKGQKTLVACGAGISRSAAFAIAALKEIEQLSLIAAYQEIKRNHPEALPHPAIWQSLCLYFGEEVPYTILIRR